jgi:hypothetical protein
MQGSHKIYKNDINAPVPENLPRHISTPKHTAYLKIADGCDNKCTYCIIPKLRGKYRSRKIEDILADAEINPHYYEFKWATPTKFRIAYDFLKQYSSENIGRALSAIGLEEKAMRLDGSKSVSKGCRYLPFPKSSSGLGDINEFDLQSNYVKNTDEEPF